MYVYLILSKFYVCETLCVLTCNIGISGDRRRLLLRGLTQSLPEILPLLYTVCISRKPHYKFISATIVNVVMLGAVARKTLCSCTK